MDKNNLGNLSNTDNLGNIDMSLSAALPFSRACENNKHAILEALKTELISSKHVLEIGSGTGQHSVYFAPQLPKITWQTSDLVANHWAINAWHDAHPAANLYKPLPLDLAVDPLPISLSSNRPYDAVFTANTLHIIAWSLVENYLNWWVMHYLSMASCLFMGHSMRVDIIPVRVTIVLMKCYVNRIPAVVFVIRKML